jgi:hypothetical protein
VGLFSCDFDVPLNQIRKYRPKSTKVLLWQLIFWPLVTARQLNNCSSPQRGVSYDTRTDNESMGHTFPGSQPICGHLVPRRTRCPGRGGAILRLQAALVHISPPALSAGWETRLDVQAGQISGQGSRRCVWVASSDWSLSSGQLPGKAGLGTASPCKICQEMFANNDCTLFDGAWKVSG